MMSLPQVLAWLAQTLGVENPRRLRLWLVRLFVLPPEQAQPWPRAVAWAGRKLEAQLVNGLGIADPQDEGEWFLRLFVLPAQQARPWPRALVWIGRMLQTRLVSGLGINNPQSTREWLLRLFVLPPAAPAHPAQTRLQSLLGDAYPWLQRLIRLLGWPLHKLQERYRRIDFEGASARLENAASIAQRLPLPLHFAMGAIAALLFWVVATTPLSATQQLLFVLLMWLTTMLIRGMPGHLPTLALMTFALIATSRYAWWRVTQTLDLASPTEYFFGTGLLLAEIYTWITVLLSYLQKAWPLRRPPVPLPDDPSLWPTVDVYVPTYNEPLKVVKATVLAALSLDWPKDKLKVYLLDDGRRDEFRQFAVEAGAEYIIRSNNHHAKAGNLNNALKVTHGEFIAVFDCDHLPVRSFLQTTMGWFLRDPKCALVQTPHHFFSPDPTERNLNTFGSVPSEGKLFYGAVQDGNDLWNATFFCGSCAVLRRGPLEEVGGIAIETVTEDAHTAMRMHRLGYTTAYVNVIQAAGLATESMSGHIGQRIRWARGTAQMFRIDNPLFKRGLNIFQRLCYTNAFLYYINGPARLVFLTTPLSYLFFQLHIINASPWMLAIYLVPYLAQASLVNARMHSRYRHSLWSEVYETMMAWYITRPVLVALINPKLGKFNVTAKGGLIEKEYFDWGISKPYIVLALLNFSAVLIGFGRLFYWNTYEMGTVIINIVLAIYNIMILGATLAIAYETSQTRIAHRVPMKIPATIYLGNGQTLYCQTRNYSNGGLSIDTGSAHIPPEEDHVRVSLSRGDREFSFAARIVNRRTGELGVSFGDMTLADEMRLIQCTFGRADAWLSWDDNYAHDRPMHSFIGMMGHGLLGYRRLLGKLADAIVTRIAIQGEQQKATNH